ncbi:MAG: sulfotransferase family protein [Miltoncostaeaceae bacterium]
MTEEPPPIVVVGMARAGTTLVARMLDAHPDVRIASDPLMPLVRALRDAAVAARAPGALPPGAPFQDGYFQDGPRAALDALLDASVDLAVEASELGGLRRALSARAGIEEPDLAHHLGALEGGTFAALVGEVSRMLRAEDPRARVVGVKEVWAIDAVPFLSRALPGCRFVVVQRDPRAVVASHLAAERGAEGHPPSVARHWRKQEALLARYRADPRLLGSLMVVRYEDVVADPASASATLSAFAGVEVDRGLGGAERLRDRAGARWTANSSFGSVAAGVRPELATTWRRRLDREHLAMVELLCGVEMAAVGYDPVLRMRYRPHELARSALVADGRASWGWRSDLGDPVAEHDLELRRREQARDPDISERSIRSAFLFPEAHPASLEPTKAVA